MAGKHDKNIKITVDDNGTLKKSTKDINKLNKAQQKVNKSSKTLDRNMKGASAQSANSAKNFSKMAQGMQGVLVPAYAELAARVFAVTAAFTALSEAANYSILLKGQQAYASQTGKSLSGLSKVIQKASKHMLSYKEAATSAALATTSGLTTKQIEKMTEAALGASVALGRNMSDSMDRLTRGIVKAEPEILDELGIIIRLDRVYKDYADTLGVATASLSEYEKMQARTNAILGQAEDKYGDIGSAIDGNQFEVLGSTVMDLARGASSTLSDVFSPIAEFLADSKLLLSALMLAITKSVLGKALPALKGLGGSIKQVPKDLERVSNSFGAFSTRMQDSIKERKVKLYGTNQLAEDFKKTISTFSKQSPKIAEALAKGLKGKKFVDHIANAMRVSINHATARIKAGDMDFGGMLKGFSPEGVRQVSGEWNKLVESTKQVSKEMRSVTALTMASWLTNLGQAAGHAGARLSTMVGSMIDFNATLYNITTEKGMAKAIKALGHAFQEGWRSIHGYTFSFRRLKKEWKNGRKPLTRLKMGLDGTTKELKIATTWTKRFRMHSHLLSKTLLGLATIGISGLLSGMNMLVGVISAISMASWALDWMGFGSVVNKTKEELDGFTQSLKDLSRDSKDLKVFGPGFSDVRAQLDRDFNLAERLEQELDNIAKLDIEDALSDWRDTSYEFVANIFSFGIGDNLAKSFAETVKATQALGVPLPPAALEKLSQIGIDDALFEKLSKGVKLTSEELDDLDTDIDNYIGTLGFYVEKDSKFVQDIQKGIKDTATSNREELEKTKRAYDEMAEAGKAFFKEQRDLGRSFVEDTPFTKYSDSFSKMVDRLSKLSGEAKISYLKEQNLLDPKKSQNKAVSEYMRLSKLAEAATRNMNKAAKDGDTEAKKSFTDRLNVYRFKIEELGESIDKELTDQFGGPKNLLSTLLGIDPEALDEAYRVLKITTDELTRSKEKLKALGVDDTSKVIVKAEASIVKLKLKQLRNTRKILLLDREKNADQIEVTERQILLENEKLKALHKNTQAVAEYNAEATGGLVTLRQKWQNIFKDFGDPWKDLRTLEEFEALETQRAHDISVAYQELAASLNPLSKESHKLTNAFDIFNAHLGAGTDEANRAIAAYAKLNSTMGKFQSTMRANEFKEEQAGAKAFSDFAITWSGAENDSVFAKMEKLKDQLKRERGAKVESLKAQGHTEEFAQLAAKKMQASHAKILKSAKERFKLERKIAKLQNINTRRKAIAEEKVNLKLQAENWKESSTMLGLRQTVAKLERDYAKEGLDLKKQELLQDEIMLAYSKLSFELFEAKRDEALAAFEAIASAYTDVATTISSGIGDAVSAAIMGQEDDQDWRQIIAQSMADSAGGLITNVVNEQLTGRKGFVASFFDDGLLKDAIFGAEDPSVQLGKDMNSLAKMAQGAGLRVKIVDGKNVPSTQEHVVPNNRGTFTETGGFQEHVVPNNRGTFTEILSEGKARLEEILLTPVKLTEEMFKSMSVATAGSSGDPINDKIIKDIISKKNIKKYTENQKFLKDIGDFKWGVNKDKFKPWHPNASSPKQMYNRTLPGIQHLDSFAKAIAKGIQVEFAKWGGPVTGPQQKLPFTGPGIPTNSAVTSSSIASKLLPAVEKLSVVLMGLMPSDLTVDPMAKPYKKPEVVDPNYPLGTFGPTASELQEGNVLEMFWNMGLRIGEKINEALGITDPTGSIDKMKVPQKFENTNPYSVDADSVTGQKLEQIVLNDLPYETKIAVANAAINAGNGQGGSTKVEVVNPNDIKTDPIVPPGQPVPIANPKGDATVDKMSYDLRQSMASNLHTQIMNDNMNARSLITNSLATVGSNLMSSAIGSMFGLSAANGAVWKGGFRAFANGGVVKQPTLGLVGEGKHNEAIVPLPDGRSIPVMGSTGGNTENNVTVNVTVDSDGNAQSNTDSGMDGDKAKQLGYMVSQAVQAELVEQQRPGGLLSSY